MGVVREIQRDTVAFDDDGLDDKPEIPSATDEGVNPYELHVGDH